MKAIIRFKRTTLEINVERRTNILQTNASSSAKSPLTIVTQVVKKASQRAFTF